MFSKNPLVELELTNLRNVMPHQRRHYFLLLLALLLAFIPVFRLITRMDELLVSGMALVILSVYWFIQWQIMKAAVVSVHHELPDEILGSYSKAELLKAKLWAILRHYRAFIRLISLAALGLSLGLMGYFHRVPFENYHSNLNPVFEQGIFTYIRVRPVLLIDWHLYPMLPHPGQIILAGCVMLIMSFVNSKLSISLTLWSCELRRARVLRLIFAGLMLGIFIVVFSFRDKSFAPSVPIIAWQCFLGFNDNTSYFCQNAHRQHIVIRIVESLQTGSFSFLDGGMVVTTTMLCPGGPVSETYYHEEDEREYVGLIPSFFAREFVFRPFMWRHLLALSLTIFSQLSLSAFLLWRASRNMGKKK